MHNGIFNILQSSHPSASIGNTQRRTGFQSICMPLPPAIKALFRSDALGVIAGIMAGAIGVTATSLANAIRINGQEASHASTFAAVFAIIFGGTMALYNADRLADYDLDCDTPDRQEIWNSLKHLAGLLIALPYATSLLILLAATSPNHRPSAAAVYLLLGGLGFAYSQRITPSRPPGRKVYYRRIKDIPWMKCFFVPGMWAVTTCLIPSLVTQSLPSVALLSFGIYIYLRTFAGGTASDIRDINSDRAAGVITIPAALGIGPTITLMQIVNVLSSAWLLLAISMRWLPLVAAIFLLTNLLCVQAWHSLRIDPYAKRRVLLTSVLETASMPLLVAIGFGVKTIVLQFS